MAVANCKEAVCFFTPRNTSLYLHLFTSFQVFPRCHGKAYLEELSGNVDGPAEDVGGSTAGEG